MEKKEEKLARGEKAAATTVLFIAVLAALKAVVGAFAKNIILLTDALHSATDVVSLVASWFGLKIAQRKPDKRFPFGYYKAENLAASAIALFIIYGGVKFFIEGYEKLSSPPSSSYLFLTLATAAFGLGADYFIYRFLSKKAQESGSQTLAANAAEKKGDILTSAMVFVGLFLNFMAVPYVEGAVTMIIAILLLKIGLETLKEAVFALMDVSPGEEIEKKVYRAAKKVAGIEEIKYLRLRQAGSFVFGEICVGVRRQIDIHRLQSLRKEIERTVKKAVPEIDSFSVRVEPFKSDYHHLVLPVEERRGLDSPLASYFARAPYFLFVNLKGERVIGFYFLKNPFSQEKVRAGLAAARLLVKQKSDILIAPRIGEIAYHFLKNYLFDFYRSGRKTAQGAIDDFLAGRLQPLSPNLSQGKHL